MDHSKAIKKGRAYVRRRNLNYTLPFGKFKNSQISKLVEDKEGLNYCIWLCKEVEKGYNEGYRDPNIGYSKKRIREDILYSALKYNLKRVDSYRSTLDRGIDQYGNRRRAAIKKRREIEA